MKKVDKIEDAWALGGNGHNFIQWKGTKVCMDFWCQCGYSSHICDYFAYAIKCVGCGRFYALGQSVEVIELLQEPDNYLEDCNE